MRPAAPTRQHTLQVFDIDLDALALRLAGGGLEVLDDGERERASRMATPQLRVRFVAAHVATREILGAFLNMEPGSLRFGLGTFGKPHLQTPIAAGLHFNLSHCRGRALLALADGEVGVDLEGWIERDTAMLAAEVLASEELDQFDQCPVEEQPQHLARMWAAKEALLKACGLGLQIDPHAVVVARGGGWHELPPPAGASPWWLQQMMITGRYCAFVASTHRTQAQLERYP